MQRLYFLTPDLDTTVNIAHELSDLALTEDEVHVLGKEWEPLRERGVHNATLRQTSDVVNAGVRGLKYGVVLGALLGWAVHLGLGDQGFGLGWTVLVMTVFGALFGIWTSTMIGVSVHDVKIDKFETELEAGAYLMLVDVPEDREREIYSAIHRHHPEVVIDKVTRDERQHHLGVGD
ncbi:hypothetical protein HPA02_29570 [Bisbaumannia pacifica]|uniref:DUF1269 domain-containing protein n=1 Tax=Bisbaumannia pacifica TaxID=77098 RepID=A0A510XB60_9GAMM|nr:DUF1269 domain-containing protein [Halomonas pacifica]GEK48674.1 hypothetical protein HPA02_29570 [Halomonas pacifica]